VLLKEEDHAPQIVPAGKGRSERYHISGKILTDLSSIEALRAIESRTASRKQAKMAKDEAPRNPNLIDFPESALPPTPKRRGRPPKPKSAPLDQSLPVSASIDHC
jgi:hypothetical protein